MTKRKIIENILPKNKQYKQMFFLAFHLQIDRILKMVCYRYLVLNFNVQSSMIFNCVAALFSVSAYNQHFHGIQHKRK